MEDKYTQAKKYKILNEMAIKGEKVILGSSYMLHFPFAELLYRKVTDYVIYNRSIEGLTPSEAVEMTEELLWHLEPSGIVLSFGETEEKTDEYYREYEILLQKVKKNYPKARICIASTETDKILRQLAQRHGVDYIEFHSEDILKNFSLISGFFHHNQISFVDAMLNF